MHLPLGEGATLHPCPHLLINDAGWLILLGMKGTDRLQSQSKVQVRKTHQMPRPRARRWVAIHRKAFLKKYYLNLIFVKH